MGETAYATTNEFLNRAFRQLTLDPFTETMLRTPSRELRVELVHGRMKSREKAEHMERFAAGQAQLLVATTVIEVGVDVPDASLMVMENAERLGLSQLHQLRGRVGRGAAKSYCVLLYNSPLSLTAKRRLQVMRETCDGFRIAEEDLRLRGPGDDPDRVAPLLRRWLNGGEQYAQV